MNFELFLNIFIISEYIFASKLSRYFIKNLIKYLFFYIQKITSFFFEYFYPRIDPLSWATKIFFLFSSALKNHWKIRFISQRNNFQFTVSIQVSHANKERPTKSRNFFIPASMDEIQGQEDSLSLFFSQVPL